LNNSEPDHFIASDGRIVLYAAIPATKKWREGYTHTYAMRVNARF
jgi:hypothetical protein